jgi:translation initiation factor IF-2
MAAKLRVYHLARELNLDNSEVIRELQHMGVPVTSHSNTVEDRLADQLRKRLGPAAKSVAAAKPVPEEQVEATSPTLAIKEKAPAEPPQVEVKPEAKPEARPQPQVEAKPEVKAEPKPAVVVAEPKVESRPEKPQPAPVIVQPVEAKVAPQKPAPTPAPPPPPAPAAPPPKPPVARPEPRGVQFVEPRQPVSPIVSLPSEKKPTPPPPPVKTAPETPQRQTMQQIVQERLRKENRLPVPPPRRPLDTRSPAGPAKSLRPDLQARPVAPAGPTATRPAPRPMPSVDRRVERSQQRYERHLEKKLGTPFVKPQPKVEAPREFRKVTLTEGVTVGELAERLDVKSKDMIKKLIERGVFATINQALDREMAKEIAKEFNAEAEFVTFEESVMLDQVEVSAPENLQPRAPVVTIMGHVDHGKTSLLDAIRKSRVTEQEHGGITQHIGAYQVKARDRKITFLDTPGHEAFTLMRARGARVTDIVVLVVAADDGVMPQTLESISHTRAAKVPLVVAINKIDKPGVNVDRVKRELADQGLMAEDWGGETVTVEVSAKTGKNLDLLLEMILLVADIQTLKADPSLPATGAVLEAKIDKGRGNVANVLVQNGTLKVGDNFIAGAVYGKVRAMFDEHSSPVKEAGPSTPVEVLGLQGLPLAGDSFQCVDDERARQVAQYRQEKLRETAMAKTSRLTLDQLHKQLAEGDVKEVSIVLKCDVQGSQEALGQMLTKLSTDKVKVRILHSSVGAITETDVLLAAASNAIIIGFNVRPERKAAELAGREKVDIRLHTIIYNVVDEIKNAMLGVLEPIIKETRLGSAEVRNTFRVPKVGTIAGCYITEGKVTRNAEVRLLRDNVVVYEGKIGSLKRFKDDASEVTRGYECGIGIQNFNDVKIGDIIEAFVTERVMDVGA